MSRISVIEPLFEQLYLLFKKTSRLVMWAFVIACFVYIGYKIRQGKMNSTALLFLNPEGGFAFLAVLFLMPFNWLLEAIKWKLLVKKVEPITLPQSLGGVFAGVAAGIFTPNRVGEFAGKILSLKKTSFVTGAKLNAVAALAQLLSTIFMGTISLLFVRDVFPEATVLFLFSSILMLTLLFFYFHRSALFYAINKLSGLMPQVCYEQTEQKISRKHLLCLLLLSVIRYLLFSLQYILLLRFSGIDLPVLLLFSLVSITFLISAIIPTFALSEVAVRGSVAVFIIGMFSQNEASVLASSLLLWIINIGVPAIVGCFYIPQLRIFTTSEMNGDNG